MHRYFFFMILISTLAASCGGSPSLPGGNPSSPLPDDHPEKGIVHWKSFTSWNDDLISQAAEAKMIIFPMQICLSAAGEETIGRIKAINPNTKIIGYQGLLCVSELWADSAIVYQTAPYEADYYYLVHDRKALTTTGDPLLVWEGSTSINPFTDGVPDTGFMAELVDLLWTHRQGYEHVVDGIMHDYFMYRPYVNPGLTDIVTGDIDLDGNGTIIGEDAAEREMFLQWQIDYAQAVRDRFGPDFIQIGNGKVPQYEQELAGILNGIFYEVFPNMCWGITDLNGLQVLLANQSDGWLSPAHGRTWSIVTNDAIGYNNYFCQIASLIAGCLYTEMYEKASFTGWQLDLDAGRPVSDLVVEGRPDSVMTYSREFSRGTARISFAPYGGRIETEFAAD